MKCLGILALIEVRDRKSTKGLRKVGMITVEWGGEDVARAS